MKIPVPVVKKVIASYTREAGVRGLDRALSMVARSREIGRASCRERV